MKNKDSKARMQMIFGILLFAFIFMAELYAIVNFPKMFIVLVVLAAADLICLYVAIRGVISVYETKYARREEQYESIFKSEKASYLMLKKYFEEISVKLAYMEEASKIPTEEIVNAQKGIAKVIIKRSHENTDALMNSYEQLMDRFDTFQKGMDGFGTVAGAYKDEILSACKDEISSVQKDGKEQEHSQDKEIAAKLQEIIIAMKDMELRLNQTIMNSQKVVVSQPQVSVPVATPVEPQPAPQNHVEETPVEPEISPEPEESMERSLRFRRIWKKVWSRSRKKVWNRSLRFHRSRKKVWSRTWRSCRIYRKKRVLSRRKSLRSWQRMRLSRRTRKNPLRKQKNW